MIEVRRRPFDGRWLIHILAYIVTLHHRHLIVPSLLHRTVTMEIPRLHPVTNAAASTEVLENNEGSEGSSDEADTNSNGEENNNSMEQSKKKRKIDSTEDGEGDEEGAEKNGAGKNKNIKWVLPTDLPTRSMNVARPMSEMKGHTAFLTFAVRSSRAATGSVPVETDTTEISVGIDGPVVGGSDASDNKQ